MPEKPRTPEAARLMIALGGPNVSGLVQWMDERRNEDEVLTVHQWIDDFWYVEIEVNTARLPARPYPENLLVAFTVNVKDDVVFFSGDQRYADQGKGNGGNCFCRSFRWMRLIRERFPDIPTHRKLNQGRQPKSSCVYDYRTRRKARPKAVPA